MKRKLLIFLYLISPLISFSKPLSPIDSLKLRLKSLDVKIKTYDSLLITNNYLILENNKLISQNNEFKEKVDYNEKLLEKYDKLNNTIFTIIGILLAFFGFIIPLIGYFFVYKPARDDLREAQTFLTDIKNNMNKLFSDFLVKNREEKIDKAIKKLEEKDVLELQNSLYQLDTFKYDEFNFPQIVRIVNLIRNNHMHEQKLADCLLFTENKYIEDYFIDCIRNNTVITNTAAAYIAKYNKTQYYSDFKNHALLTNNIYDISMKMAMIAPQYLYNLYNDNSFVDNINDKLLLNVSKIKVMLNGGIIQGIDFSNTKLFQKYEQTQLPAHN